jgi:hypothetical protein
MKEHPNNHYSVLKTETVNLNLFQRTRPRNRDPKLFEQINRLFHAENEVDINESLVRNSYEKRTRDATKTDAKQMHECKGEFFGSQRTFWLLFVRAKSNIIKRAMLS